ncbi:hypothetical protein [Nostoc sp. GT001]|uniref:hypothetical protein n=1 Tax=Nostoc sp. GT001 TaxID=3056647 RepID=UPI0025AA5FAF|nr:hypothetical protein [Nostoc sp. GT001]MDM9580333.1 hypothetical protein [Nostoc sp. GT001]
MSLKGKDGSCQLLVMPIEKGEKHSLRLCIAYRVGDRSHDRFQFQFWSSDRASGCVNSDRCKTKAVTRLGVRGRWEEELTVRQGSTDNLKANRR